MKRKVLLWLFSMIGIVSAYYIYVIVDARLATFEIVTAAKLKIAELLSKSDLSERQLQELLVAQDPKFYIHQGTDFLGGRVTTITQSLVKFLYFSQFRPGIAKIKQSLIARYVLDPLITKDEQLDLFLNLTYFGKMDGAKIRGFAQAAKAYFGKSFKDLSSDEYFKLLGMLSGPDLYNVKTNPGKNAEQVALLRKKMGSLPLVN